MKTRTQLKLKLKRKAEIKSNLNLNYLMLPPSIAASIILYPSPLQSSTLDFAACVDGHDGGQLAMLMSVDGAISSAVVFWRCR